LILSKSLESKERLMIRRVYLLVFWGRIDGEEFRKARVLVLDHFTFMVGWMLYCVVCLGRQNVKVMASRRTLGTCRGRVNVKSSVSLYKRQDAVDRPS